MQAAIAFFAAEYIDRKGNLIASIPNSNLQPFLIQNSATYNCDPSKNYWKSSLKLLINKVYSLLESLTSFFNIVVIQPN